MNVIATALFAAAQYFANGFARLLQAPQDDPSSDTEGYHLELAASIDANLVLYFEVLRTVLKEHMITHVVCDSGPFALTSMIFDTKYYWQEGEKVEYREQRYFKTFVFYRNRFRI